jgi:diguanylate cyclase
MKIFLDPKSLDALSMRKLNAVLLALVGGIAIASMGLFRWYTAEYSHALIDFALSGLLLSVVIWIRSGRYTALALSVFALLGTLGASAVLRSFGSETLGWVYMTQVSAFLVTSARQAVVIGAIPWVVGLLSPLAFIAPLSHMTFLLTSALILMFSYVAATRSERQQVLLATQATHDPLTNAGNRRLFEKELERAVAQQLRGHSAFGLAVIDLDHFKEINDKFGHSAGDRVLIELVQLMTGNLRGPDRVFRIGGEEFAVLFPDTEPDMLKLTLQRLHRIVSGKLIGPNGAVYVSMGGASLKAGESGSAWLHRADMALYAAKNGGRNKIEMAEDH